MIDDPTLVQPHCAECGLPIRSQSFGLETPHYRFETPTPHGVVVGGTEGIERPRSFMPGARWIHDDPRGVWDHEIGPQAFGPRHTHETDYERQLRNWRMEQMISRSHLGDQFKGDV